MILDLKPAAKHFEEKLKKVKVLMFDVDGILTDGHLYWASEEVGFNRIFHVRDGYGIRMLRKLGLKVGIISGGNSVGVRKRYEELGVDFSYLGNEDKRAAFNEILEKFNVTAEETLYIGDELFDMPLLKRAGFSATIPSASEEVREAADYVTQLDAGKGCVREVIDMLKIAQNLKPIIPDFED
jgi:3-deoxy-D-manno-octulosonate 8-phosphate phosphatase (KDO 8-P phosphatase)